MDLNNNQMLLLAVAAVALYFFMKYRQCSKQENFSAINDLLDCKKEKINQAIRDGKCKNETHCNRKYIKSEKKTLGQIHEKECIPEICKTYRQQYDNNTYPGNDWGNCRKLAQLNCNKNKERRHCNH